MPAVAGPSRLVPLASLANGEAGITITALRAAAERGRLRAQKSDSGIWLSSKNWLEDYEQSKYQRTTPGGDARRQGQRHVALGATGYQRLVLWWCPPGGLLCA
ncbi:MAG: hypothetical protein M3524_05430 [Actinomycetota bacterium]|nr:hypothetical protein [Actinomycetota bacterium]